MDDSDDLLGKVESSPRRKEYTLLLVGADPVSATMVARDLVNRWRAVLGENKVAMSLDLVGPDPEITISEVIDCQDAVAVAIGNAFPRELPTDLAMLEARIAKPELTSWKDDKLGRQVSNYGPQVRKVSFLRNKTRKGRK